MSHYGLRLPEPRPAPEGLLCRKCNSAKIRTRWDKLLRSEQWHERVECESCGALQFHLAPPDAPQAVLLPRTAEASRVACDPPPPGWEWIGWVRTNDGVWRAVALAGSLERCWEALLHSPLRGDFLVTPTRPGTRLPNKNPGKKLFSEANDEQP